MKRISLQSLAGLLRADLVNIARDPLLVGGAAMAIVPGILLFAFGPDIEQVGQNLFDTAGLSRALAGLAILMGPAIFGWIFGFLLLEDRDGDVLLALEVTPLGKTGFMAYRLALTLCLSVLLATIVALLVLPAAGVATIAGLVVMAGAHAMTTSLFLVGFAANKVEGLALTKLINIMLVAPLVAFAPAPWRFAGGVLGPYWMGEMLELRSDGPGAPIAFVIGMALSITTIALLYRRVRAQLG